MILLSLNKFQLQTDLNDLIGSMEFENSLENTPFYEYINFISIKRKRGIISRKIKNSKTQEKSIIEKVRRN